ncbi:MAG: L-serine ammonia-lyase [Bacteriovoracia bacterium]
MILSIFNLFNIGIGPSSSHTVGPMRAANFFIEKLKKHNYFDELDRVQVKLCGSLSSTGIGHGTDSAVIAGLTGLKPELAFPEQIKAFFKLVKEENCLNLNGSKKIAFSYHNDLIFDDIPLPFHPNGMIFYAYKKESILYEKVFYSVGGGFIVGHKSAQDDKLRTGIDVKLPFNYDSANQLLQLCKKHKMSISQIAWQNELALRSEERINEKIKEIWDVMKACVSRGLKSEGSLPGKMLVKRRAKSIFKKLKTNPEASLKDPLTILDWVNLYALAVNEENADGGRVVTAPTNGAAGIVPAVMLYHQNFCNNLGFEDVKRFLLTAGAIAILYKKNASISGAEVGCQGEVGVACSMAAAGLTEVLGGSPAQVENAAEIGMEHNLGLTCDPVEGQVQLPCIERNAMGSIKAINAARIALRGNGKHLVSLDKVMKTMKETGFDMQEKYKETSKGGLAVNITEC